jgi:tetratricopeptide (TPR) repeat protein
MRMGIRFRKSIKIAPGLRINLSKSGPSLSVGRPGATFNVGPKGTRTTVGAPGTGISYTTERSWGTLTGSKAPQRESGGPPSSGRAKSAPSVSFPGKQPGALPGGQPAALPGDTPAVPSASRLELSFFQRLSTPDDEEALVDGCRELALGDPQKAYARLQQAVHLADGAYLAGLLAMRDGQYADAANYLSYALEQQADLGRRLAKYGIAATVLLPLADDVSAVVAPNVDGVMLALSEAYQHAQQPNQAAELLRKLAVKHADDLILRIALVELLVDAWPAERAACDEVLALSAGVENDSDYHALLLLYRARALRGLGLKDGARDVLTGALKRTKDRAPEVLLGLRYERALIYAELGQDKESRTDLEKIYAADPGYEDVKQRLGL